MAALVWGSDLKGDAYLKVVWNIFIFVQGCWPALVLIVEMNPIIILGEWLAFTEVWLDETSILKLRYMDGEHY